ncbi:MAG TPA: hypothetical protein VHB50_19755 [Bryobacteraceae bacterium]|nr:hypothetical protein [Bryobacteraceae bacterium]
MKCPLKSDATLDLLLDYSAGRLDRARSAMLESHMAACEECAAFRVEQGVLWEALDAWQPAPASADFNRRLWSRIEMASRGPWYRWLADFSPARVWMRACAVAAIALLLVAGLMLEHSGRLAPHRNMRVNGVSITEADQLERTLDDIQLLRQVDAPAAAESGDSRTM